MVGWAEKLQLREDVLRDTSKGGLLARTADSMRDAADIVVVRCCWSGVGEGFIVEEEVFRMAFIFGIINADCSGGEGGGGDGGVGMAVMG